MRRKSVPVVGVVALALLAAPTAEAAARCAGVERVSPAWTSVKAPPFPVAEGRPPTDAERSAQQSIRYFAVDPLDPARLYVTNRYHVLASADGGCSWQTIYGLPELPSPSFPYSQANDYISTVAVAHGASTNTLYLTIDSTNVPAHALLRSTDGGATWSEVAPPSVPLSSQPTLHIPAWHPEVVYLALRRGWLGGLLHPYILRSTDGGTTWEERTNTTDEMASRIDAATQNPSTTALNNNYRIAVEHGQPDNLWMWDTLRLRSSSDGGATWTDISSPDNVRVLKVIPSWTGSAPRMWLVPATATAESVYFSDDRGASWTSVPTPGTVADASPGTRRGELVIVVWAEGVYRLYTFKQFLYRRGLSPWVDITPPNITLPALDLVSSLKGKRTSYFCQPVDRSRFTAHDTCW